HGALPARRFGGECSRTHDAAEGGRRRTAAREQRTARRDDGIRRWLSAHAPSHNVVDGGHKAFFAEDTTIRHPEDRMARAHYYYLLAPLAAFALKAAAAEHSHPAPEKLGTVTFATTCAAAVQPRFERAVALLHSFAYAPAENAFREVAAADPG